MMKTRYVLLIAVILASLFTLVLAVAFTAQISSIMAPSTHKAIIDQTQITMIGDKSVILTPVCVYFSKVTFGRTISILPDMKLGSSYQQSVWIWQQYGDTQFCLKIWGPAEDGVSYLLDFGKMSNNQYKIVVFGQTAFDIPAMPETDKTGHYLYAVKLTT
jgi:hypothetical protein